LNPEREIGLEMILFVELDVLLQILQ